jgi:hypothetical protein
LAEEDLPELLETRRPDLALSPWGWPAMLRGEAEAAWEVFTSWVDDVLIGRYDNPTWSAGGVMEGERIKPCWFAYPDVVDKISTRSGSSFLSTQREYRVHVLFARFADFELVITDPVVATVGVLRLFDPGDCKEMRPERVGAV